LLPQQSAQIPSEVVLLIRRQCGHSDTGASRRAATARLTRS
jgi:hypothetical protein